MYAANSAGTGAGLIWFLTYVPYNFLELEYDSLTLTQKILSCLASNTGISLASQLICRFEGIGKRIARVSTAVSASSWN